MTITSRYKSVVANSPNKICTNISTVKNYLIKLKKLPRKVLKSLGFAFLILIIYYAWNDRLSKKDDISEKVISFKFRPWYFKGGLLRPEHNGHGKHLWPNEARGDRIINQLMFVPKTNLQSKKKIYSPQLQNLKYEEGSKVFYDLNCPVKNCEIVFDPGIADAVIFENTVTRVRNRSLNQQIWIFHTLESPFYSGKVVQQTSVNWTATYRRDSDLVTPYEKWVYYNENKKVTKLERNYAEGKTKKVVWFVSNCKSSNKRLEYAKELAKYISVDIYGACGDKVCLKNLGNSCENMISRTYKFYLSFENANCRDYITEKFYWNALRLNLIPVVMGAPREDYEKVAPHKSFIHVEDFSSPEELARYLHHLDENDSDYNSYFLWKNAGEFVNTYFMCRLCAMLQAGRGVHFYQKITHWWRKPGICTKGFWNYTTKDKILKSLSRFKKTKSDEKKYSSTSL